MIKILNNKLLIVFFLSFNSCVFLANKEGQKQGISIIDYSNLNADTTYFNVKSSGDTIFILEFNCGNHKESLEVDKDTITHKFYSLGKNNEYWINDWILYTSKGKILENESEYLFLVEKELDSIEFKLINNKNSRMELVLFEYKNSMITKPLDTVITTTKSIALSKSSLENIKIKADIIDTIRNEDGFSVRTRQIFVNRKCKLEFQKHLKFIE